VEARATLATRCDRHSEASSVGGLFLNSAERDIPQCRRSLTSRPAMPASGSSGVRRARRSTIRLFQDSRCARMRGCNSHIGVTQPDPACLQHMQRGPHARSSCRRWPRLQRSPAISTRSAAHLLNAHQLFVQNFAADRDREKGVIAVLMHILSGHPPGKGPVHVGGRGPKPSRGSFASQAGPHMREERVVRVGYVCNAMRPAGSGLSGRMAYAPRAPLNYQTIPG